MQFYLVLHTLKQSGLDNSCSSIQFFILSSNKVQTIHVVLSSSSYSQAIRFRQFMQFYLVLHTLKQSGLDNSCSSILFFILSCNQVQTVHAVLYSSLYSQAIKFRHRQSPLPQSSVYPIPSCLILFFIDYILSCQSFYSILVSPFISCLIHLCKCLFCHSFPFCLIFFKFLLCPVQFDCVLWCSNYENYIIYSALDPTRSSKKQLQVVFKTSQLLQTYLLICINYVLIQVLFRASKLLQIYLLICINCILIQVVFSASHLLYIYLLTHINYPLLQIVFRASQLL